MKLSRMCFSRKIATIKIIISIGLLILFSGCDKNFRKSSSDQSQAEQAPTYSTQATDQIVTYRFGIHPLHNPTRLIEVFGPLVDYLNRHISGVRFEIEASRNYPAFEEKLKKGELHFALPNPYQTIQAMKQNYHVWGKMGDDFNFRGIILVRKDSGINSVKDLKGKVVSYPAATALAAAMLPQYYLYLQGIDVLKDTKNIYVGSQESSIMNVYLKQSAAGATWPPPWKAFAKQYPERARELEVKWTTTTLPNNALVVRNDVSKEIVEKVSQLIFHLHETPEGKEILARMELSRFESANEKTYASVEEFVKNFSTKIRNPRDER